MSEYPGYKYCFIDTETTGVERDRHHVFQISGRITDPDLNTLESFNFVFRPHSLEHADPGALEKTRMTVEDLAAFPMSAAEAYEKFIAVCGRHVEKFNKKDKMHFVAYNAGFDADFMRKFFQESGDNYFGSWFWHPPICVMQAAAWLTQRVRGAFVNFQLGTVCAAAGIGWDETKAHDADYDIQKTVELFKYVTEFQPKL
jgi:DNA polymerase-3 subunit epsilon